MKRSKELRDKSEDLEKLAVVFSKYEVLFNPSHNKTKSLQVKLAQAKAYKELVRELNLPDISTLKAQIQRLKTFSYCKMRHCVSRSVNRGLHGHRDALKYAPEWLKKLDEPWNLFEKAFKAESRSGLRSGGAARRAHHVVRELLRCAERAAARARCPRAAARALSAPASFQPFARAARLDLDLVHGIWTRYYDQAVHKLMALINVGDCSERLDTLKRFTLQDWRVIDVSLLYDVRLRIVREQYFYNAVTLYPMILLFKLMIAAKEKIDQRNTAKLKSNESHTGCQKDKSGARTETEGSNTDNDKETNVTPTCRKDSDNTVSTSQAQHTSELSEDELSTHKEKLEKKPRNEYETAEIWALVHSKYTNCGRSASAVLLQKRWYEIKQQTRALLCGATPVPLLLAMGKRFPFILTETLPSWKELVRTDRVFLDSDLEPYKFELFNTDLEVPDIDENILFDEINDWSDDEVEIINENREVITVSDSDDEQINITNRKPNIADLPSDNINRDETSLEIDKINTKIDESDISIKTIESLDPTSAKVKIIFEDDSDSDVNEYLNCPEDIKDITLALNSNENLKVLKSNIYDINTQFSQETEQNSSKNTRTKDKDAGPSSECTSLSIERSNIISNDKIETKTVKDEKLNYLLNTISTNKLNTASHKDNIAIKNETNEKLDDTNTQLEAIVENNDTVIKNEKTVENYLLTDDISHSHVEDTSRVNDVTSLIVKESEEDEIESLDDSVKCEIDDNDDSTFVDEKLVKLSQVVLTPLEEIDVWRKFSKLDTINCRRFSVRNFSKVIHVTSKQLAKCRPYVPPYRASRNGISRQKNSELNQMAKSLRHKRRSLTKRLKLPRTYFSLEFWNERNVGLLESCKPVLVRLERVSRVVKKVELANIEEVRRINRTILTAQVAPITVGSNRTIIIDSTKVQAPISETQVRPTNISIDNQESNDVTPKTPAYYVNLPSETEVREMIKKIVRRGGLAKLPDPVIVLPAKNDVDFGNKQRRLDRDIREMSTRLLKQQHERIVNRKEETKQSLFNKELKLDPNINCSQEWQRQKSQNLIYFNLRPKADETDRIEIQNQTSKNVKKKRKKPKKPKEKTEENIKKEASVIQSENVNDTIKRKHETMSDVTNVTKDLENNFSTVTCVSSRKSSESDSEMGRLVINLDTTTDQDLKRKSLDTPPDTLCKITKVESKATIETENTSTIASDCVIDLCDDSNDKLDINALANVPRDGIKAHDQETQNNASVPQIKIKIVQNTIEINGDCESKVPEDKSGEILTFLSKVAARIQAKNKTAVSTPTPLTNNSTVYYVIKSVDKDQQSNETTDLKTPNAITETSCNRNTNVQPLNIKTDVPNDANVSITANPSSLYYVVKVPDLQGGGPSVIPESLSPPMPIIQSVSSLNQIPQRIQKSTFPPNLRTYPQNLGDEIDINYKKHMSSTSMPMRRNNSVPMPITSVTALPSHDLKTESSSMPWPNTNHPATVASQKIYPVTVTSGNSRSETAKEEVEGGIQVIPIWNVPETNFMPKVATKLSTSTQANDLLSVKKQTQTSPRKRVYGACKKRSPIIADKSFNDEVCLVKEEFPLDIVENGVGLPSSNDAPPDNSLRPSNVIKREFSDDESNFNYIVKLKPSKNNPINLGQSSGQDDAEPSMLTIIREKKRKTGCERVRAYRARQRALKALADRNKKIIIAKTSTERSRAFRARQKAKQSVDGSQTTNKTSTDESDNDAINKPLQDENILKSPSENSREYNACQTTLNIHHNKIINNSSSESEDLKTEVTDQETSSYLSDASNEVSVKDEPIFYGSE
ncbi:uncharacterized protein LOC125074143 [Vanessa atalanta]|uniref:uncharacterized protein LOC125074143 n=1 Tax=Vanessa atalanta TaxID=42275 RepID=UPI001FCDA826|nr:uncharacterized protein LOC125074143 [Vanessa atalanta]